MNRLILIAMLCVPSVWAVSPTLLVSETLTLQDALQRTLVASPQLLAVEEGAAVARAQSRGAFGGMLPNISAGYDWSVRDSKRNGVADTSHTQGTDVTLVQPITLGNEWSTWRTQAALARASDADAMATRQEVQVATATAYVDVLAAEGEISGTEALISSLKNELKASNLRLKVGEGTRTDVAQSEARLASAQATLAAAEGRYLSAHARLRQLVGIVPDDVVLMWPDVAAADVSASSSLNPAVQAAEERARAARHTAYAAWWEFLPEASVSAATTHDENATNFGGGTVNAQVVQVNVRLPLFAGGQNVANLQSSRAQARRAKYELEDIRRAWGRMVATARSDMASAKSALTAAEQEVAAQERANAGVVREQQLGTRSQLEALNAAQELAASRTRLALARRNVVVAHYNLLAAEGRLVAE